MLDDLATKGKAVAVEHRSLLGLIADLAELNADFPGLTRPFRIEDFYLHSPVDTHHYYDLAGIRSHTASVLGKLTVAMESPESVPVIQGREFSFIRDPELRKILERDYTEIQRAYVSRCWKSVIILSGGGLEAILLDLAFQNEARAKSATKAPKKKPDLTTWDLNELIEVCMELKLIGPYVQTVSNATRAYRNLVHPGNEVRTSLRFGEEEAKIAITVLDALHRDLSK